MLQSLYVKNYAIIQSLRVEFSDGLNILSGETGAGKSIIVGSLSLLLGGRGSADMIRSGEKKLTVEGVFFPEKIPEELKEILAENDIECDDGIIIRREITDSSKNTCRINDTTVSVAYLKRVGSLLVDIHGQHEHQRLLSKENHLGYLDMFAGENIKMALSEVEESYDRMRDAARVVKNLQKQQKEVLSRKDEYISAVDEIGKVDPKVGEDEEITSRLKILESAEKIYSLIDDSYVSLYGGGENALSLLSSALGSLEKASAYDESLEKLIPMLNEAVINVEESVNEIRNYRSALEFEPYEIDSLNERLASINRLKRKYGEIGEIISKYNDMKLSLEGFGNFDEEMKEAEDKFREARKIYNEKAENLSALRKTAAEEFSTRLVGELNDMAMKDAQFEVRFEKKKESRDGIDDVEFFITANKGQPLRELSKTASGGEISRVMLSLKSIIGINDDVGSMIFDEIDTGISGNTAKVVGQKMASLSKNKQIIAITHLAQIASMADGHFLIEKKDIDDVTSTSLRLLERDERIKELSRIIGSSQSDTAITHAKSLLEEAEEYKNKL